MEDWIIFTLTAYAFIFAGGLFLVLFFRYRHWEKEQIARAQEWQKRSAELLAEYRKEVCNGKRRPANIDADVCQSLFDANPETFNGYSILAGKALLLALFDRRTARRLHVMGRTMEKQGHKNWGGTKK